ncbi:MAG: hypothetical protein IJ250_02735 [Bacteroidales bacterium]|nr:hypothetical protein [Bacteroidales bacterium]
METKKLKRLKIIVGVMYVINMTAHCIADVATATCAYYGMVMPAIVCFVAAALNGIAVWLLDTLHDAMVAELEERQKPKNNITVLFPAKARTEAD